MEFCAQKLGSENFRSDHHLKYAYVGGSMYKGIASSDMVVRLGKAGMLGYLGTGGMGSEEVEAIILKIQVELNQGQSFGMNLLCNMLHPESEREMVELFLKHKIERIEASAFTQLTPWIVLYRAKGLYRDTNESVSTRHRILAKISRPEVAEQFLKPCPEKLLLELRKQNYLTDEEVDLAKRYPVADDICVESDSGGAYRSGHCAGFIAVDYPASR